MKPWARFFDKCVKCGLTEHKHESNGFCKRCRVSAYNANKKEKAILGKINAMPEKVVIRKGDTWKVGGKSGFVWELKGGIVELRNYLNVKPEILHYTIGELATGYIESDNPNGTVVWVGVL